MGTRTTPGGDDPGSETTPSRRSAKQLQQNALTRPRSGRRAASSSTDETVDVDRPAGPVADQRPRSRTTKAAKPAKPANTRGEPARPEPVRREPVQAERGGRLTQLVDETELAGPSVLEVDVTPAELVAELEGEGLAPVVPAEEATPRSRREARREATRPRAAARPRPAGGSRRPPGIIGRLPVVGRWRPQNRKAWGSAIATTLVLLIPGTTLLSPSDPIVDGTLNSSNGNLYGTRPTLDGTTQDALVPTTKPEDTQKRKYLDKPKQGESPVNNSIPSVGNDTASPDGNGDGKATGDPDGTEQPENSAEPTPSPSPSPSPSASPSPSPKPSKKAEPKPDTPSAGNGKVAPVSGLGWASGAFIQGDSAAKMQQFAQWRGRGMNVVVTYTARSNWTDTTTGFDWLLNAWKNTNYTVVVGVPPFPENSGGSLNACASGAYNDKWKTFARTMKASGYADRIIIRLGWEFNGGWYEWKADNPSAFASCWRQIVGTVEEITPALRWDWNVNRGPSSGLSDAKQAWPGDAYVDIVGVDSYDWYPGVHNAADWSKHVDGDQGLNYWLRFARAHGKKMSFPEWGLYTGAGSASGGDNPYYIKKMMAYFKSIQGDLAYESYFNDESGYIQASLFGPDQNPTAADAYRDVYSAG